LFTRENFALQEKLQELNTHTNVLFCGSYFWAGFHEDGLVSALAVVDALRTNTHKG
jgi:predicted NAD/FAD-binding protein